VNRVVPRVILAVALLLAGCGHGGGDDITGKSIRYEVEYYGSPQTGLANRAVIISYAAPDEGVQEQRNVQLPWTKDVGGAPAGFTASVKARFYGFGTIVCRILADDELIVHETSMEEPYPQVECAT
jgi:hypothetical protein